MKEKKESCSKCKKKQQREEILQEVGSNPGVYRSKRIPASTVPRVERPGHQHEGEAVHADQR